MAIGNGTAKERLWLKRIAGASVVLITIGLTLLNTTGAWTASGGNPWYTATVAGAEIGVAVFFGLAIIATTWLRKYVGILIFAVLVWACIENGKMAIKQSFDQVFIDSPESLRQKAELLDTQAPKLEAQETDNEMARREEASRLREQIAALQAEQNLMSSPNRVREAQQRLQTLGLYTLAIDGRYGPETQQAMLARGDVITREIAVKQNQLDGLTATQIVRDEQVDLTSLGPQAVTLSPAQVARATAVEMRKRADEIEYRTVWMHLILIAFEGARSFGVWAFLMTSTASQAPPKEEVAEDDADEDGPAGEGSGAAREQAPEPDPRADWTDKQWNSLKGADARKFREETLDLNKLRVPPVLRSTASQAHTPEAATPKGPRLFAKNDDGSWSDLGDLYKEAAE